MFMDNIMSMDRMIQNISRILDFRVAVIIVITLFATWFCNRFGIAAELPMELFAIAIIIPLLTSIYNAFKRREIALERLSDFKGNGVSIYFASRDWIRPQNVEQVKAIKLSLKRLYTSISVYLFSAESESSKYEHEVHQRFSEISKSIKALSEENISDSEFAQVNGYLGKMLFAFHDLKIISNYRTPIALRNITRVSATVLPVLYAPFFAYRFNPDISLLNYIIPAFFCAVIVSLDNIQEQLEDPYDQIGEDDIKLDVESFVEMMK